MTTATLSRIPARPAAAGAVVGSILGCIAALGLSALALLVVPVAALVAFGPALLELF